MANYQIGTIAQKLGLTADTLRYYEKIGLLPKVSRNTSGIRQYDDKDVSCLKFIQRAQRMNFSLAEIGDLLSMRKDPQHAKDEIRKLTSMKLNDIETHINELTTLRNELQLLLNLCRGTENGCPIIEDLDTDDPSSS
ncbi:MAG: Cu(I)-responsive transcriptional regulator [Gammaproteobacteria bacterium]|nr:MAG: Cu(I)-responsive transcriptional regulator [Gammaproteobacteria bacterium]